MNIEGMLKSAYYQGFGDGLANLPLDEREARAEGTAKQTIQAEIERLRENAEDKAVEILTEYGIKGETARRMVAGADTKVSADGLRLSIEVEFSRPQAEVIVHVRAPE